jgi:hypothetical protein
MSSGAPVGHSPQVTASFPAQAIAQPEQPRTAPCLDGTQPGPQRPSPLANFPNQPRFPRGARIFEGRGPWRHVIFPVSEGCVGRPGSPREGLRVSRTLKGLRQSAFCSRVRAGT